MRWLVSLFFVLALGLMGCSETTGTGGTAGDGGNGGAAGTGGDGGNGGMAGTGGTGGVGGATDCADPEQLWCALGGCLNGACRVFDCQGSEDGTLCIYTTVGDHWHPGACAAGVCEDECSVFEEGAACAAAIPETGSFETGVCANGQCEAL